MIELVNRPPPAPADFPTGCQSPSLDQAVDGARRYSEVLGDVGLGQQSRRHYRLAKLVELVRQVCNLRLHVLDRRPDQLRQQINGAAAAANVANRLKRIGSTIHRRLSDGDYEEKAIDVHLRGVEVEGLVAFLHHLTSSDAGLDVKNLRLVAPQGAERGETWNADVTLAYLVFAPRRRPD